MTLPSDPETRLTHLVAMGLQAGLDRVGVTDVSPFSDTRRDLVERKRSGLHGGLTFTYNHPDRATDVSTSFPWSKRLVVGGRTYLPAAGRSTEGDGATGRIARFAVEDFYVPLRAGLQAVVDALTAAGHRAEMLVDDNRLVDRAAAVRAGIGWWGKNTMVLAPGHGPWMLLGSVITDAEIATTEPMNRDCGTCSACIPACPTGALIEPGVLDARRCLAAIAQLPGRVPVEFRLAMGDRIYGCDDCLDACPPGVRLADRGRRPRGRVDLTWILGADDDTLLAEFDRFYLPRRRPDILRRNALVAAGNSGDVRLAAVVARYLDHDDAILVEHAEWALEQLCPG